MKYAALIASASMMALGAGVVAHAQTATAPAQTQATQSMPGQNGMTQSASTNTAMPANPMVGGAAMEATKTIPENAAAASNLTTLVAAVKAADLVDTLSGPGPFTVFAPTNAAFGRLAPGTVDTLLKPENKETLVKVLTYHVVPGKITLADLREKVTAGGGKAMLTTVEGEPITVEANNGAVILTDVNGNKSYIETPDVRQSNGIVHVVNGVVIPKLG
ncbi:MAG: fasciclin [Sphingomonas sp. 28-66-16]|nr:MAG: fasciclin [Sphingomonas sp. 28-66-16]